MSAGLTANVTLASVNQQVGASLANLVNSLNDLNNFNTVYLGLVGTTGLQALGATTGDANNIAAAVFEAVKLYEVMHGTANIAANGTITEQSTGHNFFGSFQALLGTGI